MGMDKAKKEINIDLLGDKVSKLPYPRTEFSPRNSEKCFTANLENELCIEI
jgi:hypothetical protein